MLGENNKNLFQNEKESVGPTKDALQKETNPMQRDFDIHKPLNTRTVDLTKNLVDFSAKISDMGLGKLLLPGHSVMSHTNSTESNIPQTKSASSHKYNIVGSTGYQAPEILANISQNNVGSKEKNVEKNVKDTELNFKSNLQISQAVDIFSLGCIFYNILCPGGHPFGEVHERERNILAGNPNLDKLFSSKKISADAGLAEDLILGMISSDPRDRLTISEVCMHPYFWNLQKRLTFVLLMSDRIQKEAAASMLNIAIENNAKSIIGGEFSYHNMNKIGKKNYLSSNKNDDRCTWDTKLDAELLENSHKYRSYNTSSVQDLLRILRNKAHHFKEMSNRLQVTFQNRSEGVYLYFHSIFPNLFLHTYKVCQKYLLVSHPLQSRDTFQNDLMGNVHVLETSITTMTQGECELLVDSAFSSYYSNDTKLRMLRQMEKKLYQWRLDFLKYESLKYDEQFKDPGSNQSTVKISTDNTKTNESPEGFKMSYYEYIFEKEIDDILGDKDRHLALSSNVAIQNYVKGPTSSKILTSLKPNTGWWESSNSWKLTPRKNTISYNKEEHESYINNNKNILNDPNLPNFMRRAIKDGNYRTGLCRQWEESEGQFCKIGKNCNFAHGPVELKVPDHRIGKFMSTEERSCDTTNKFLQIYPVDTIEKNNTSINSSYAFSGENDNLLAARKALLNRGKKADNYENFGKEETQNHGEVWYEETALEEGSVLPTEDKLAKRKENHITDIKGRLKFKSDNQSKDSEKNSAKITNKPLIINSRSLSKW